MAGRPSDYKEEYCDMVINHMEDGYSFESFAGLIRCHKDTLYEWVKVHPEFSDAKKVGFEVSRLTWEKIGIDISKKGEGNSTAFIFNMKNRFKEEWRDSNQTDITTKGESLNNDDISKLSNDEKLQLLKLKQKMKGNV